MIHAKTSSGFELDLDVSIMDNMELLDAIEDIEQGNPLAVSRVCKLMLGTDGRKKLYDHLRTEDGRVPSKQLSEELLQIMQAFGQAGKN